MRLLHWHICLHLSPHVSRLSKYPLLQCRLLSCIEDISCHFPVRGCLPGRLPILSSVSFSKSVVQLVRLDSNWQAHIHEAIYRKRTRTNTRAHTQHPHTHTNRNWWCNLLASTSSHSQQASTKTTLIHFLELIRVSHFIQLMLPATSAAGWNLIPSHKEKGVFYKLNGFRRETSN